MVQTLDGQLLPGPVPRRHWDNDKMHLRLWRPLALADPNLLDRLIMLGQDRMNSRQNCTAVYRFT